MTKSNITEYDNTAANNTDVQDVPLGENQMYPSNVNNAFREIMADLADINDGTVAMTSPSATSLSVTNNITVGGTVDGRDVATDGTKLDGIEAGATNVSALTDLSITDGTNGQVLTTDGAGTFTFSDVSASNADTLDSLDSTQFLRSDADDTASGNLTFTGDLTVDTNTLHVDASSDKVSIGTTTGVRALTVNETGTSAIAHFESDQTSSKVYFNDANTSQTYSVAIGSVGDDMAFYAASGGDERMRIASGDVGIGTTSPTGNYTKTLHIHGSSSGASLHITDPTSGATASDGLEIFQYGNDGYIWERENGTLRFATNATERMRLSSAGELNLRNNLDMNSDDGTATRYVHLPRGGGITFYGDDSVSHSITSRNNSGGTVSDDLRIASYGSIFLELDSNNNNTSGADLTIRKNSSTTLITVNGESGLLTLSGGGIDSNGGNLDHDGAVIIRNNGVSGQGDNNTHFNYQDTGVNYIRGTNTYVNSRLEMAAVLDMNNQDIYGCDAIFHDGDTNTYMQFHASDQWRVVTGGTERLEVNSNGVHGNGVANKWARFEQIGTHSTSGSKGISSLTDEGTGITRLNFSGNFSNTSYCCPAAAADASSGVARRAMPADGGVIYTSSIRITVDNNGSTNSDAEYVHASLFHATGTG